MVPAGFSGRYRDERVAVGCHRHDARCFYRTVLAGCLLLVTGSALAVEWSVTTLVSAGVETDDNVGLVPENPHAVSGYGFSPQITGRARTPTVDAQVALGLDFDRFDDSNYDSDDQDLTFSVKHVDRINEYGVTGGLKRDSTRTSELEDTGRFSDRAIRKENARITPYWTHRLDERNSVKLGLNYQDVTYQAANYSDYQLGSSTLSWVHQLTGYTAWQIQFYTSNYNAEGFRDVESDASGLRLGYETALTQRLELKVLVGASRIDTSYQSTFLVNTPGGAVVITGGDDDQATTAFADMVLTYTSARSLWNVRLNTDAVPSGDGYLRVNNRVDADWIYQLTERIETVIAILYGEAESLDDRVDDKRDYINFEAGVLYRLTENWDIATLYRHRAQDQGGMLDSAESDALFVTLRYHPPGMVWSR